MKPLSYAGMIYMSHFNTACLVLSQYTGETVFSDFIKKYFKQNKKFGSRDRKVISHLCYCFFRMGKAIPNVTMNERILLGLFLCSNESNEILKELKPGWDNKVGLPLHQKLSIVHAEFLPGDVFPWKQQLSESIAYEKFCQSFFIQPDLFIRTRPGKAELVKRNLQENKILFKEIDNSCLELPNGTKLENIVEPGVDYVIQDLNSQGMGMMFKTAIDQLPSSFSVWDCCAGSGGKSLLLFDLHPGIDISVSDIRGSILNNLKKRFDQSGINKYESFVADLSRPGFKGVSSSFDLIVCDAPCTGSGTWSRTPEQLYFFDERKIDQFATIQRKIISNVLPYLNEKGFFIYITCSVFRKENEEAARYAIKEFDLEIIRMEILEGYEKKADTLFAVLFRKN
ncbi:MAG TPA: hypothetical protein VK588_15415 [Chitinophagaceae bacterium]|nr:hypothetical protein [Chitinophagaceae bacterium]